MTHEEAEDLMALRQVAASEWEPESAALDSFSLHPPPRHVSSTYLILSSLPRGGLPGEREYTKVMPRNHIINQELG